jgi:hypothetical protein
MMERMREHRRKIAENPWPFPPENMNYVLPMMEMDEIAQAFEKMYHDCQVMREALDRSQDFADFVPKDIFTKALSQVNNYPPLDNE